MKNIFLTIIVAASLLSCNDFLDEPNDNYSNNPLSSSVNPAQTLAATEKAVLDNEVINFNSYGNKMSYAYALNSGFTSSDVAYRYNYSSDSYGLLWENTFIFTANCQDIINSETKFPLFKNHVAIAKILKAQGMEKIINLYGDAPYSEAFNTKNTTPKYDDDIAIYKSLLLLLDNARQQITIANSDPSVIPVTSSQDIVFGGVMDLWTKYANTLELRMLLKLSNTTNASLVTLRNARFLALSNNFIDADVTYNPGFTGATALQSNPIFRVYGTNVAQTAFTQANRANAAGDFIAQVLNGTYNSANLVSTGIVDPRRNRMFSTVPVSGAIQGTETSTSKSRLSGFVFGYTGADAYTNGTERDAYIMLASESYFLQAEAAQRGYIPGNAQTLFYQGIDASFTFYSKNFGTLNLIPINATAYKLAIDSKIGLGWTASTNKISCIMTQKWLAIAQWTGIEPYFDMLRTGFPKAPLPLGVSRTSRPNRLIYPTSEYSSNSANVPSVTQDELFSINAKTPYYLQ
jgi:hypothetical protein